MSGAQSAEARSYQIGTVSSLTGVDPHTIRAWERRHQAIVPMRTPNGRRLYRDETVERLQLLKGLVDCNEAIGTIAKLSDDELRQRLSRLARFEGQSLSSPIGEEPATAEARATTTPRVAFLAPTFRLQLEGHASGFSDFEIQLVEESADRFAQKFDSVACDVAVLELERLDDEAISFVQGRLGNHRAPRVIVLYRFATRGVLAKLVRAGATPTQLPVRVEQLRQIILDQLMIFRARNGSVGPSTAPDPAAKSAAIAETPQIDPPRRFSDEQLARLFEITSAIDCECPNHLSSLVSGLAAFEAYSRQCASRDDEDARQHQALASGTARARSVMEDLLSDLCRHEGISV